MAPHILAKDILNKIIYEEIPFSLALKQAFKRDDISKEDRSIISAMVGCVLRHYLVMKRVIDNAYPEIESQGAILIMIALSNALFIKKMDQEVINKDANGFIKEGEEKVEDFIAPYLGEKKLVPCDIDVESFEFLSYRYNTPIEIVRMWNKQFGHISMSKALRFNSKPAPVVVRINNKVISDEGFFAQNPDFEAIVGVSGAALYKGEGRFKNNESAKKNQAIPYPLPYKEMLLEGDLDFLRGVAIYTEYQNDLLLDFVYGSQSVSGVEYMASNINVCTGVKNFLNKYGLKGINVYEAQASSIITCLSKPVHTFIVMPDSSRLNLLQLLPDYFLRFDINKLDELIANQKAVLKEASAQVEDGGYLLYLVDTLSKKESIGVINEFLSENKDFSLVRDKLYFPYKKYGGSYYFAVLKKAQNND